MTSQHKRSVKPQCKKPRMSKDEDGYFTEYCIRVRGHRGDCNYVEECCS